MFTNLSADLTPALQRPPSTKTTRPATMARKLMRSALLAGVAGCTVAAMAGTAQAAPSVPNGIFVGWVQNILNCAPCGTAFGRIPWIDPAGSLQAGTQLQLQVRGTIQGRPASGATVYLSDRLTGDGAIAMVGTTPLSATPQPFSLDAQGRLPVTYQVAGAPPGAVGTDALTVAGNAAGSGTATVSYDYDQPASFTLTPVPIAPAGSLAAGQSATARLVARDAAGRVVGGALVSSEDDGPDGPNHPCGSYFQGHPPFPPHNQVGSVSDPTYAFTNASGKVAFSIVANGGTGGTDTLQVAGQDPAQSGPPATTSYSC